jgi:arylsulfatase
VPAILHGPGVRQAGVQRDLLCSSIDLMPTLLELAGVAAPDPSPMQGLSLVPALDDAGHCPYDALLIENQGVRRSVRTGDALLTWHGRDTRGELYDLAADPDCLLNLWDAPEAAGLQAELLHTLIGLMAGNVDPLPVQEGPW